MAPALTEPERQKNRLSDQTTGASPVQPLGDQTQITSFQTSFLNSPILTNNNNNINNNRQNSIRVGLKGKISQPKPYLASDGPKFGPSNDQIHMEAKQDLSCSSVNLTTELVLPTSSHTILRTSEEERKEIANSIMGLQKDYLKDQPDVEQMLGELASGEIDLLQQVFKSLEEQVQPTGDGGLCDLGGGLSLFNDVDVMNMCEEVQATPPNNDTETQEIQEEIEKRQAQMQRKCDFLVRRLRKLQARTMGPHTSEEIAGVFEYSQRHCKKKDKEFSQQQKHAAAAPQPAPISPTAAAIPDIIPYQPPPQPSTEKLKPLSALAVRNFVKRVESMATQQHQNASKRLQSNKFFSTLHQSSKDSQNSHTPAKVHHHSSNIALVPKFDDLSIDQMDQVAGMLQTEMKLIQKSIDSEATESSSGGESADEMTSYNNLEQQSLSM
jgi:KAT8 regulatory NSL complex subunit 1